MKTEPLSRSKRGKRVYLNDTQTRDLMKHFNAFLKSQVEIPRFRGGKQQIIDTLINEEMLLLGKLLRNEKKTWSPRIVIKI